MIAVAVSDWDFAMAEDDNAASEAPAADIFINLRRLYIAANIENRFTKTVFCISFDTRIFNAPYS